MIRSVNDVIVDEHGTHAVTQADLERDVTTAPAARAKKLNIPIPVGGEVEDYEIKVKGGYVPPVSYIRLVKKNLEDTQEREYVLEKKDEVRRRPRAGSLSLRTLHSLCRCPFRPERAPSLAVCFAPGLARKAREHGAAGRRHAGAHGRRPRAGH